VRFVQLVLVCFFGLKPGLVAGCGKKREFKGKKGEVGVL
jgi:hypothetical protein